MRIIILAAGLGSRLRPLTNNKPKCLIEIEGEVLLEQQLETIKKCGLKDIIIVGGFEADQLTRFNVPIVLNSNFSSSNMVESLFCAEKYIEQETIVSYGDILYAPQTLASLIQATSDITVVVDNNWREYWSTRMDNWIDDVESLRIGEDGFLKEIGNKPESLDDIQGQYIGLMKFRANGVKQLRESYSIAKSHGQLNGRPLRAAFMTDILQDLIERGQKLTPLNLDLPWVEIDTVQDVESTVTKKRVKHLRALGNEFSVLN